METFLNFYFSINDLLKDDLFTLISNDSFNSYKEYKTLLWGDNNNICGDIIYKIEIKNDNDYNCYTTGTITIIINNLFDCDNILFEIPIFKYGNKLNLLTESYNTIINDFFINKIKILNSFNITIEPCVNNSDYNNFLLYSILSFKNNINI
jgi:hypothetical protein